jgi:hypothetical protein
MIIWNPETIEELFEILEANRFGTDNLTKLREMMNAN